MGVDHLTLSADDMSSEEPEIRELWDLQTEEPLVGGYWTAEGKHFRKQESNDLALMVQNSRLMQDIIMRYEEVIEKLQCVTTADEERLNKTLDPVKKTIEKHKNRQNFTEP